MKGKARLCSVYSPSDFSVLGLQRRWRTRGGSSITRTAVWRHRANRRVPRGRRGGPAPPRPQGAPLPPRRRSPQPGAAVGAEGHLLDVGPGDLARMFPPALLHDPIEGLHSTGKAVLARHHGKNRRLLLRVRHQEGDALAAPPGARLGRIQAVRPVADPDPEDFSLDTGVAGELEPHLADAVPHAGIPAVLVAGVL